MHKASLHLQNMNIRTHTLKRNPIPRKANKVKALSISNCKIAARGYLNIVNFKLNVIKLNLTTFRVYLLSFPSSFYLSLALSYFLHLNASFVCVHSITSISFYHFFAVLLFMFVYRNLAELLDILRV